MQYTLILHLHPPATLYTSTLYWIYGNHFHSLVTMRDMPSGGLQINLLTWVGHVVLLSSFQYSSSKNGLQQRHIQRVMESLASMDVLEVGYWMKGKGFKQQVVNAFEGIHNYFNN